MNSALYNQKAEKDGEVKLSEKVFGLKWNPDLAYQVIVSMRANKRTPIAHVKERGEVSGGGKKPWRQKGTGRARHGSTRSPIWIGGGVTHGPRNEKDYSKKINKKMKTKALLVALSRKLSDNEIIFLDNITLSESKTKKANEFIKKFGKLEGFSDITKKGRGVLLVLADKNDGVVRAVRNLSYVSVCQARNLNILDVLSRKYIIIPQEAINIISETFAK